MLVLTRKLDEAIRIGDDIKITVLRVKGNTVRIGIEAPREVRVVRDELDAETPNAAVAADARQSKGAAALVSSGKEVGVTSKNPRFDVLACPGLMSSEGLTASEDGAVVTAVVDSPEPSGSRLFVGKIRIESAQAPRGEQDGADQAAPLRAFLRSGRKLQAAG